MKTIYLLFAKPTFSILLLNFFVASVHAQWSNDPNVNNVICDETQDQVYPRMISDGAGGAIITWDDLRNSNTEANIYMQRINSAGLEQWTINGATICDAERNQSLPKLISDQNGGAIICWQDYRNIDNGSDIYAQRVDASGVSQWTANGIVICNTTDYQYAPIIVEDGAGGAIICWGDFRDGEANANIYAQRINSSGVAEWAENGVAVNTGSLDEDNVTIVSDGSGGAIITWREGPPTYVYTQRLNNEGVIQWTGDGVVISDNTGSALPAVIADGNGGAIITWIDHRNAPYNHLYAQKVYANGDIAWTTGGVEICTAEHSATFPTIVSDGSGGAIITWEEIREGFNIYAQKINSLGEVQWITDGIAVCAASGDQAAPVPASDGSGGAIITWGDKRGGGSFGDIYAQKINASGDGQWTTDGVAISTANNDQNTPAIISDGVGGAIISWGDGRGNTDFDIYAQQVSANGVLGLVTDISDESFSTTAFALYQNHPNPVKQSTTIQFEIYKSGPVVLKVYDLIGNEISTLINEIKAVGKYKVGFDASNCSPGIYIYKLEQGLSEQTKRMVVMN